MRIELTVAATSGESCCEVLPQHATVLRMIEPPKDPERFWSKVHRDVVDDACWLWKLRVLGSGYPQFWLHGRYEQAHRVAYVLQFGPLADGMWINQSCGNRSCMRHLKVTTRTAAATLRTPVERFWAKVNKRGPIHPVLKTRCWLWTGHQIVPPHRASDPDAPGYGQIWVDGKYQPAHRFSLEQVVGKLGADLEACHHCDNPPCVRPDHLFAGTSSENHLDSSRKGRTFRPQGETHHMAELTDDIVRKIHGLSMVRIALRKMQGSWRRRASTRLTGREIRDTLRLPVSVATVLGIMRHKTWKHLT